MIIGIDASNIGSGGGLNHLVEVLSKSNPVKHGFEKIIVWAPQSTLDAIYDRSWIVKYTYTVLEKNFILRSLWQWNELGRLAKTEGCTILFAPGGSFLTKFRPIVTMSQNLLPFEWSEINRYGLSLISLKLLMLRWSQTRSFKRANGVIFLTKYAKDVVLGITGELYGETPVISHGLNKRFFNHPRKQKNISEYNNSNPLNLIYVSSIEPYKHHVNVIKAVSNLRRKGVPVVVDLYGSPTTSDSQHGLDKFLKRYDPKHELIKYHGLTKHDDIHAKYLQADIAIFASSCETFGQILIEGMAAGLPTVCSKMSAMPEILGNHGIYFDPLSSVSIETAILRLINFEELREKVAHEGYYRAKKFSWEKCANQTFELFNLIASKLQ